MSVCSRSDTVHVSLCCTYMMRNSYLWETFVSWTYSMRQDFINSTLTVCHSPSQSGSRGAAAQPGHLPSLIPPQHLARPFLSLISTLPLHLRVPFSPLTALTLLDTCFFPLISYHQTGIKSLGGAPSGSEEEAGGGKRRNFIMSGLN